MSQDARLNCAVTITSIGLSGDSVAKTFNDVKEMKFNYFEGTLNIVDVTGSFYFPLVPVTTVTYTIAGTLYTIVVS